jgi:hypothetical protein
MICNFVIYYLASRHLSGSSGHPHSLFPRVNRAGCG